VPESEVKNRVSSIENRLRRLEERGRGGRCPECDLPPEGHGYMVLIDETGPEESFEGDAEERCGRCGRLLYTVIRVVYDPPAGEEEGGGGVSYGAL
jgi:hypothetical protein